ncbi:MAG: hypothetical protein HC902_10455 [Calothrix sp. SM1_5_4]|nr:hypothetical protein [Calothrix sp. SM1_5_4]
MTQIPYLDAAELSRLLDYPSLVDALRDGFAAWTGRTSGSPAVLNQVAELVAKNLGGTWTADSLRGAAAQALTSGRLELRGPFPQDSAGVSACNVIFYDAYSNKMDPDLWREDMLVPNLASLLSPNCVFSTYAATGSLNRSLRALGFRLTPKKGFSGKRESTLAIRGNFS